jgi:alpha-beta hydrolase superfamily lysophospholipase
MGTKSMFIYKLIKKPFFGKYMVKWKNPLTTEQQKEWKLISVKSNSGATIIALFAKSIVEKEKATIVLGHPMGKEAKGYFLKNGYTDLLRNNGYNTIVFDINGFGESTNGNFSYFEDILAIGIEASILTPNIPIGYFGISLGGQWATIAFANKEHKYSFAIIESAATSLDEFWVNFPMAYKALKLLNFLMPNYKKKIIMKERIKEAKKLKSLLLIYSENDNWTPLSMGETFKKNSAIPTELWSIKNAKHAAIMKSEYRVEYEQKIINFFDSNL